MECIMQHVRDEVLWFAAKMEKELKENDHKTGWDMMDIRSLLRRARQEMDELEVTIDAADDGGHGTIDDASYKAIVTEAADVANFMMMIGDNIRNEVW